jgi:GNAT superfamily N-acetyltransferase
MGNQVEIKQLELAEQDALLSFLRVAYADEPRRSEPAFWRWHHVDNPFTSPDNLPIWIIKSGEQIAGQLGALPIDLKIGTEVKRVIWFLDFVIAPELRGQGLGKKLMAFASEFSPTRMTLGFNEQSARVFHSLKWMSLEGLHRYQRLLFPGNALREISQIEPLRKVVNACWSPFLKRSAAKRSEFGTIREVTEFDDAFADLWTRAASQWTCAIVRSPRYLEWQYLKQPGKKFNVLGLYEHDRLRGYIVLFFRKGRRSDVSPKVAISDICYDANDGSQVVDALLRAALRLAIERRAGSMVADVLDPLVESRLRPLGFWQIKASPQFMVSTNQDKELLCQPNNWFLTRGDCDVSIFEEPNL